MRGENLCDSLKMSAARKGECLKVSITDREMRRRRLDLEEKERYGSAGILSMINC